MTRRRRIKARAVSICSGSRQHPARDRAAVSKEAARPRDRQRGGLHRGTAERRRWPRRDLSADGQHRDDVRGARKSADYPPRAVTRRALDRLLVIGEHEAYCQPCVSPVGHLRHATPCSKPAVGHCRRRKRSDRLPPKQVLDIKGTGGETAGCAPRRLGASSTTTPTTRSRRHRRRGHGDGPLRRATQSTEYDAAIARGREWIQGRAAMALGRLDVNNLEYYLNNIPFSDHGALLDPPTETSPPAASRCWPSS